jgi:RNA polymerase sigma-32 factor
LPRITKHAPAKKRARAVKPATGDDQGPSRPGDDADPGLSSERDAAEGDVAHDPEADGEGDSDPVAEIDPDEPVDRIEAEADSEGEGDRLPVDAGLAREVEAAPLERFDPLAAYLREVQKHPLLSAEETQALAVKFVSTQDSATAARLVTANLRLVVKIAYEYRRAYKNIMDLIQEGNIGLMQAVKRYDPYRGVKLSSYAAWWIRAYILRFILNNWRLVKLGTTQAQRKLFFNLRKKRAELQAMGVDPTNAEIAKQLNVPESDVAEMEVRLQASEKSLDAPIGDGDGRSTAKIDTMPSLVEGPEMIMADSELQGLLKEKLSTFRETLVGKDKEIAIFDERLVSDEPLTLQELGDRFGISRERVRQLEQRLTGRLRDYLRDEMGDAVELT